MHKLRHALKQLAENFDALTTRIAAGERRQLAGDLLDLAMRLRGLDEAAPGQPVTHSTKAVRQFAPCDDIS